MKAYEGKKENCDKLCTTINNLKPSSMLYTMKLVMNSYKILLQPAPTFLECQNVKLNVARWGFNTNCNYSMNTKVTSQHEQILENS